MNREYRRKEMKNGENNGNGQKSFYKTHPILANICLFILATGLGLLLAIPLSSGF